MINAAGEEVSNALMQHDQPGKQIYDEGSPSVRFSMYLQKKKPPSMGRELEFSI